MIMAELLKISIKESDEGDDDLEFHIVKRGRKSKMTTPVEEDDDEEDEDEDDE